MHKTPDRVDQVEADSDQEADMQVVDITRRAAHTVLDPTLSRTVEAVIRVSTATNNRSNNKHRIREAIHSRREVAKIPAHRKVGVSINEMRDGRLAAVGRNGLPVLFGSA